MYEVYAAFFGCAPASPRSRAGLPLGARVEIEAIRDRGMTAKGRLAPTEEAVRYAYGLAFRLRATRIRGDWPRRAPAAWKAAGVARDAAAARLASPQRGEAFLMKTAAAAARRGNGFPGRRSHALRDVSYAPTGCRAGAG
jgi:hypothetical protein